MRAIWSGAISFGLVNVPVKLYPASESNELRFKTLHKEDLSPVRYAKICRKDGKELGADEIVRGYEYEESSYVVIADEDFEKVAPQKTKRIEVVDFTDESEVDSRYFDSPYFLKPDKAAEKPYALLREALRRSGKIGLAKYVLRKKEHLVAVKTIDDAIVLQHLRFAQDLRATESLNLPDTNASEKELELALALVEQLSAPFQPEKYSDTYTEALTQMIQEKVAGGEVAAAPEEEPESSNVVDLMAALKASLERTEASPEKAASGD